MKASLLIVVVLSASSGLGAPVLVPRDKTAAATTAAATAAAAPAAAWNPLTAVTGSVLGAVIVTLARKGYELIRLRDYYHDLQAEDAATGNYTASGRNLEQEKSLVYKAVLGNPNMVPTAPAALVAKLPQSTPPKNDVISEEEVTVQPELPVLPTDANATNDAFLNSPNVVYVAPTHDAPLDSPDVVHAEAAPLAG